MTLNFVRLNRYRFGHAHLCAVSFHRSFDARWWVHLVIHGKRLRKSWALYFNWLWPVAVSLD